jgi:hypothetical protein
MKELKASMLTGGTTPTGIVIGVAQTDVSNVFKPGRSGTGLKRPVELETEPQKAA